MGSYGVSGQGKRNLVPRGVTYRSLFKVSKIKPFFIAIKEKVVSVKRNPVQYSYLQKLSPLASFKVEHTAQKTGNSHTLGRGGKLVQHV